MDLKFKTFALQKALLRKLKEAMDWEKISQYIGLRKDFYLVFMKNTTQDKQLRRKGGKKFEQTLYQRYANKK